ncbi:MAG: DUF4270 domain-containing protein [Bacteroidales bacterium]|jgi:hypothetical protein|nr:DUF4270 domain-containing protein [Bacteroidales bacterium]MCI1784787.1 DUF4270 domain-containing protein [Bacteroidales bacterium]
MNSRSFVGIKSLFFSTVALIGCVSCVTKEDSLGNSLIAGNQKYNVYTAEIPLDDVSMEMADSLSGYSSSTIAIGAIRDNEYGLTTRGSAFTLVPLNDTLDFGKNAKFESFHFAALADSVSIADEDQRYILQNIYVYELKSALDYDNYNTNATVDYIPKIITKGIPVYNGTSDTLSFDFTKDFGEKYMQILNSDLDSINHYTAKFPGIYIRTNNPVGNGGRINMFDLGISYSSTTYYITGNYAELKFTADYGTRTNVDTSFLFYFGPTSRTNISTYISNSSTIPQYAFNVTGHSTRNMAGKATDKILVEGGGGLKPVFSANEIRNKLIAEISKHGKPSSAVINKATLKLSFDFPSDYSKMYLFPQILSPTCRIRKDSSLAFAGLTDVSETKENQGDINRSLCEYTPDISYHVQEIVDLKDTAKISNYDVWLLIMAKESDDDDSSDYSDYYNQLMYSQYYNSLYGSSYGYGNYGYSDYGYSGYGYNNYYNYLMASAYSNSSSSSSSSTTYLDKDRYYRAYLDGPTSSDSKKPMLLVTYALPKSEEE